MTTKAEQERRFFQILTSRLRKDGLLEQTKLVRIDDEYAVECAPELQAKVARLVAETLKEVGLI